MDFKKLAIKDKETIDKFFRQTPYEICVYSPQTLIVWSADSYHPVYSINEHTLFTGAVFHEDSSKNHMILPIFENGDMPDPKFLSDILKDTEFHFFQYVPENYIEHVGRDEISKYFSIEEKQGDSDYIFKREDLSELKGRKYSKKRNLINQFLKNNPNNWSSEKISKDNMDEVLIFLEDWCLKRDCGKNPDSDIACEKQAAMNAIINHELLDYKSIVLKVNKEVQAFAFASRLNEETYSLNFQKASAEIKGLYQFFDQLCAKELFEDNVLYINKESDMDDEGLRKAKRSYYPDRIIKSYNLYPVY